MPRECSYGNTGRVLHTNSFFAQHFFIAIEM
jgi:hypothetical protein